MKIIAADSVKTFYSYFVFVVRMYEEGTSAYLPSSSSFFFHITAVVSSLVDENRCRGFFFPASSRFPTCHQLLSASSGMKNIAADSVKTFYNYFAFVIRMYEEGTSYTSPPPPSPSSSIKRQSCPTSWIKIVVEDSFFQSLPACLSACLSGTSFTRVDVDENRCTRICEDLLQLLCLRRPVVRGGDVIYLPSSFFFQLCGMKIVVVVFTTFNAVVLVGDDNRCIRICEDLLQLLCLRRPDVRGRDIITPSATFFFNKMIDAAVLSSFVEENRCSG